MTPASNARSTLESTPESNAWEIKCVEIINGNAIIEASGNVTIDTIEEIARTGVDVISSSAIVAKAKTLDIALDM